MRPDPAPRHARTASNERRFATERIHQMAAENTKKIASTTLGEPRHVPLLIAREMNAITIASEAHGERSPQPLPCPLQGRDHVCCVYAARPLRCRILHAISISKEMSAGTECRTAAQGNGPDENRYEQTVAEGIELGVARALKSAGLSADVYELNSALATALETPDAAERWANGDNVFRN